jgi:putative ubiquitin-RnfH superfamily antitoxin RatB of RatAB toxin-antitoxin module
VRVVVAYSPGPRQVLERTLDLAEGSTAGQAVQASGLVGEFPQLQTGLDLAIWGRPHGSGHVLREGDRVEVLRPLRVDPKVARRERFNQQGSRAAGLFVRGKRPGTR